MTNNPHTASTTWDTLLEQDNRHDPNPLYAQLRTHPVQQLDNGAFLVTGYDEVVQLMHDPRISSDPMAKHRAEGADPGEPALTSAFVMTDPPVHDRLRRQTMRHFGPPHAADYIDGLRQDIDAITNDLIDGFAGRTEIDVVESFAYPLPVAMICDVLGVPPEDEPRFHAWSSAIIAPPEATDDADAAVKRREADEASRELAAYLGALAESRRGTPQGDLLSGLVNDHGPDGPMSQTEVLNTSIMLLVGGHETTVNMIANGTLTMLRHPDTIELIRDNPHTIAQVFEELIRVEPPAQVTPKYIALADVTVAGVTIPEGAPVWIAWAAANRDPRHFPEPDRFDPHRAGNDHLSFGAGIHACFGAPLARLETQIALATLFRRLVNPRLVLDPPPYRRNALLRGPSELRVTFDGVRPAA
ncbi:cytochrome P450 [Curtobacterium flaccumfaciens]|uniref:cytochrome P450 n=1 Tax=Curtobacterium flaccumfaciens TaxID=2035 RepID=UPI000FFE8367|nr:cytochrome P450 [Curtobacterium flaccumfaciens]MBF4627803.1 cytochrome P450 [Curtobacterium flaccumfaciens]MBO9050843.1 cytochrome P450 [Curtobacterium flaccumfaciens pv. flaccumfaciens]MCS0646443.1 cytochrome P450 [Curtobacterium flaccumfaciens pv. flaccumfaciens]MCS6526182.1 cytochrome P450 [Curtobacterium flaccumfaciens pv. flaccumfaciens]NUU11627.1 cytochrome P450 [Curtobacterium flaccumfaciens]